MILGRSHITLSSIRDIVSVTRYYKLQSSIDPEPDTPTDSTISSWSTTEPTYTEGSTNRLYTVEKTTFSFGSPEYSAVSLSSSYEAAKAAYNRAVTAATTATNYLSYNSNTGLDISYTGTSAKTRVKGNGVEIFDGGGNSAAFFGTSNNSPICRIGREDSSNFEITEGDISATDSEGNIYWNVQDLREETVEISYEYSTARNSIAYYLYKPYEVTSIKVDGEEIIEDTSKFEYVYDYESWSSSTDLFLIFQADYEDSSPELYNSTSSSAYRPDDGAIVTVLIKTRYPASAFTFFSRMTPDASIGSFACGYNVTASGFLSFAEGLKTVSSGNFSHAEGYGCEAVGELSHAQGHGTEAIGYASHAEGMYTLANGWYSHTEGFFSSASGEYSHAEGGSTQTGQNATYGHAEGFFTKAMGSCSHAEGYYSEANGFASHAQNAYTTANSDYQTVIGMFNEIDSNHTYAFIIGNGQYTDSRSNAISVEWDGTLRVYGKYQNASGNEIYHLHQGNAGTSYPIYWNNLTPLRLATKVTSSNEASQRGMAFMLANGYYAAGGSADGSIDVTNAVVYLAGGCDATSRYITSPVAYYRTYNAAANMYVTVNGYIGRSTSSSIKYKHDVEYLTNSELSTIDDGMKMAGETQKKVNSDTSFDDVLYIPIVKFKYNEGYVTGEADFDYDKPIAGFIAEDVAKVCPECATYIEDEDGNMVPEAWDAKQLVVRMLYVLQKQQEEIKQLKESLNE